MNAHPEPLFLGVDAGGTKTHAVLAREDGTLVAEARSGPGNPLSAGDCAALASLRAVVYELLARDARMTLGGAHFGVAGAGRPEDLERVERLVRSLKLPCPATVSDDAKVAFHAAADPPGAVLICGTGSIAVAFTPDGTEYRAGGHGYLLGDEGSGYWIGREAVRVALRSADGRGEPTELERIVPEILGRASLEEVVSAAYAGEIDRPEMAALAVRILELEDFEAARIIAAATGELVLAVRTVLAAAGIEAVSPRLVLSGGLLGEGSVLRERMEYHLGQDLPSARIVRGEVSAPAVGAARLARLAFAESGSLDRASLDP